jgi:hypothetical protein
MTVFSQPTLDYNLVPEVGDTFTYYSLSSGQSLLPGNSGSDVVWDFSSLDLSNTSQFTVNYSDPDDTPYGNSFPNSNLSKVYSLAQIEYYNKNSDSISYLGEYSTPTTRFYHDGLINLKFPSTFGDTFIDDFASNFTQNGNSVSRTGTVDVTFDGYGTLILPDITISNTIRIRTVKETIDVSSGGTTIYTDTLYHWYSPNLSDYVLYYYVSVYQGSTASFAHLMHSDDIASIGSENKDNAGDVNLYPNPAKNLLNIALPTPNTNYSIKIFTSEGQLVKSVDIKAELSSIDISDFSKGFYLMKIIGPENVLTKKFMVD